MIQAITSGWTQTQQFYILFFTLFFIFVIIITFLLYVHRLLSTYSKIIREVLNWNQKFDLPMTFSYSWLKGVKIGVQEKKYLYVRSKEGKG